MTPAPPLPLDVPQWALTVDDYHRMGAAGILDADCRVELVHGRLIAMSPIGAPHLLVVNRLTRLFAVRVYAADPPLALVSVQNALRLGRHSEPEPDLALLHPDAESRFPTAADALLVVEVSDTTARYDRRVKAPLYASAGVPEYWVVRTGPRTVEVHRQPEGDGYASVEVRQGADLLSIEGLPAAPPLSVDDVFAPLGR